MSSGKSGEGNVFEALYKQQTAINKLVVDGKRDPAEVVKILQSVIGDKSVKKKKTEEDTIRTHWEELWKKFGLKFDPAKVFIPAPYDDYTRVLMMPKGLRQNFLEEICKGLFPCWFFTGDLDETIPNQDRYPLSCSYAILVRDRQEADEELKNLSANQLSEMEITAETLPERMVHEIDWNSSTNGGHLDEKNITLCRGSRYFDGRIPSANWSGDRFEVCYYGPGSAYDYLRARSVVVR